MNIYLYNIVLFGQHLHLLAQLAHLYEMIIVVHLYMIQTAGQLLACQNEVKVR